MILYVSSDYFTLIIVYYCLFDLKSRCYDAVYLSLHDKEDLRRFFSLKAMVLYLFKIIIISVH